MLQQHHISVGVRSNLQQEHTRGVQRGPAWAQTAQNRWGKVCISAFLAALRRGLIPQRAGSVWEQPWEHGRRMLWLFHSARGNLCKCYCYKACFLKNNFCFIWDILGLVLGINFEATGRAGLSRLLIYLCRSVSLCSESQLSCSRRVSSLCTSPARRRTSELPNLAASLCPEAWTFNFQDSNVAKAENCIVQGPELI